MGRLSVLQSPDHVKTIDITKPDPRAYYRYHKARVTGNLLISQSPNQGKTIDITKPETRVIYRYQKARGLVGLVY